MPLTALVASITPGNPVSQIANMHTLFNIATTILLIPFGGLLATMAERLLPDKGDDNNNRKLMYLNNPVTTNKIGTSAIFIEQVKHETERMLLFAKENVTDSFTAFREKDVSKIPLVEEKEQSIDFLNKEISNYISKIIARELDERESQIMNSYFKITGNIERIGDHAMNICGYSSILKEKKVELSQEAKIEITKMRDTSNVVLAALLEDTDEDIDVLTKIAALEQKIDDMTEEYRNNMLGRMKHQKCSDEGSILYSEILTDFERIGDHALNISQELAKISYLK